jgi:hypothetical protein
MTRVNSNMDSYIMFLVYDAYIMKGFYFLASFLFLAFFHETLYTVNCVNFVKTGSHIWFGSRV